MEEVVTNDPKRFWDILSKLGSRTSQEIPMEIVDENGILINDINTVLGKWKNDYNNLYNKHNIGNFEYVFYNECMETVRI